MLKKYQYVGKRLKNERIKYGLNLNDLAKATDLSTSFLSLLENGKAVPSLKVLDKLCSYFSIHIATLFEEEETQEVLFIPKQKQIEVTTENERSLRFLLPKAKTCFEPVLITLYPSSVHQDYTVHKGIEYGYVLEGVFELHLEHREPIRCKEGDSIMYHAGLPHKLINSTSKTAKGLWINMPETESFAQIPMIQEVNS